MTRLLNGARTALMAVCLLLLATACGLEQPADAAATGETELAHYARPGHPLTASPAISRMVVVAESEQARNVSGQGFYRTLRPTTFLTSYAAVDGMTVEDPVELAVEAFLARGFALDARQEGFAEMTIADPDFDGGRRIQVWISASDADGEDLTATFRIWEVQQ